jgi:hypothetical protein
MEVSNGRERPALIVKGRLYDVTTRHLLEPVEDFIETAAKQVVQIHCSDAEGDVLVFMPGGSALFAADVRCRGDRNVRRYTTSSFERIARFCASGGWLCGGPDYRSLFCPCTPNSPRLRKPKFSPSPPRTRGGSLSPPISQRQV